MDEVTRILIFTTAFTVSAAVLIVLSFIISRRRQLQHKKQLLEKEYKTREDALLQLSRDLHDDIGSSLSGINMLNQLAQQQCKQPYNETVYGLLQKINAYTNEVIEKVSDMAWLVKSNQDSLSILIKKLKDYSTAAASSKNIVLHFNSTPPVTDKELSLQQRKNIYLISKEAINNAVKYAACKNIYYTMQVAENTFQFIICDDGTGFTEENSTQGNGLQNMRARAAEINAAFKIDSAIGSGTIVELELTL